MKFVMVSRNVAFTLSPPRIKSPVVEEIGRGFLSEFSNSPKTINGGLPFTRITVGCYSPPTIPRASRIHPVIIIQHFRKLRK